MSREFDLMAKRGMRIPGITSQKATVPKSKPKKNKWDIIFGNLRPHGKIESRFKRFPEYKSFNMVTDESNIERVVYQISPKIINYRNIACNFLIKMGENNDTLILCHWHPSRNFLFERWLKCVKKNKADILMHVNHFVQNPHYIQQIAAAEMEKIGLDEGYKYMLSLHSDILIPPDTIQKMRTNKDIVSAVVPRPIIANTRNPTGYVGYINKNRTRPQTGRCPPHLFMYNVATKRRSDVNPTGRLLPYNKGLFRVASAGMGCCMMSRKMVKEFGIHKIPFQTKYSIDTYWSMEVRKRYGIFAQTDIRCKHLCPPIKFGHKQNERKIGKDPLSDKWFGWTE